MDDADYRELLKRYSLETLRDIERHINRELYPERWDWVQQAVADRQNGVEPLPAPALPEFAVGGGVYGGFWLRVLASAIDVSLIYIPAAFWTRSALSAQPATAIAMLCLVPLVFPLYNVLCLLRFGQTPGKAIAGLQVVTRAGTRPSATAVMRRHLPDLLAGAAMILVLVLSFAPVTAALARGPVSLDEFRRLVPLWDPIDDLWDWWIWSEAIVLLFNSTCRGFHDYLGATWVVRSDAMERFLGEPPAPFELVPSLRGSAQRIGEYFRAHAHG